MTGQDPEEKKKTIAILGATSLILICMVVGVVLIATKSDPSSSTTEPTDDPNTSNKAIQSICQPTDYRQLCEDSIRNHTNNSADPKDLVKAAFNATRDRISDAMNHSAVLRAAEADPRTRGALDDCKEMLNYAILDLERSVDKFVGLDISKIGDIADDLKTWLSGTVTYQETCLDGFENTTGDAAESMRKFLNGSEELSSNALAIMNQISSVLTSYGTNRRLLSEEEAFPGWVTEGKRKLLGTPTEGMRPNVTVAQDGSGDFRTVGEAISAVPKNSKGSFVIYVKEGVYKERNLQVNRSMINVMMYGDGATKTKITGSLNFIDGTPTFKTATFSAIGDGFMARDLGFENSAGPEKHQAVALHVQSDRSVFYRCQMDGYQDTLYAHTMRQFYRECTISGTIDFIFGDAISFFQNCQFLVRKPLDNQQTIVTAQGRKDRHEATGIVIHNCTISPDASYVPFQSKFQAYLGRPWKPYSRTIIMQSEIGGFISPQGWMPWLGDVGLSTLFYTEFDNRGPGADTARRVTWRGIKKIDFDHAEKFTVERFVQGNQWLPATGVPYIAGLLPVTGQGRMH